jgi:hypothetical protein
MIETQRLLAANPETAPEVLRELSQNADPAIRQAVAGNPNVPIEILWGLVGEFPHKIIANPLSTLIAVENPTWIMDIPGEQFVALLQQPNPPSIFIEAALQCIGYDCEGHDVDRYGIRPLAVRCIANDPCTSIEDLEKIMVDHAMLHSAIIEHPDFGLESFKKIAKCDDWAFKWDLVSFCFNNDFQSRFTGGE